MATRKRSSTRRSTGRKPAARKPTGRRTGASKRAKPAPKRRSAARAAKPAAMPPSAIGMLTQHMDYTSQSMDEIKRFYTELLGFKTFMHMTGEFNYLSVTTGPSSSLGFMPPMENAPEQWRPPREPALYFMVADVNAAYERLSGRGVLFDEPPRDMPWGHRVTRLRDPEGRLVCLAQQMMK